jgi:hypothetical protein
MTDSLRDYFDRSPSTPLYWYNCANDLRGTAASLHAVMHLEGWQQTITREYGECGVGFSHPAYEMLCGLSLELLLKAIAVARRRAILDHHLLIELANHCGVILDDDDRRVLQVLTASIRWSGRYPIPKSRAEFDATFSHRTNTLFTIEREGEMNILVPNDALSWQRFNAMWQRFAAVYWEHHYDV